MSLLLVIVALTAEAPALIPKLFSLMPLLVMLMSS